MIFYKSKRRYVNSHGALTHIQSLTHVTHIYIQYTYRGSVRKHLGFRGGFTLIYLVYFYVFFSYYSKNGFIWGLNPEPLHTYIHAYIHTHIHTQGFFVTVRAGTAYRHLFFQVKKKQLFVTYIANE